MTHAGGVFSHMTDPGRHAPQCPLKNSADCKYQFLREPEDNPERAARLRTEFFAHWQHHYVLLKTYLDYLYAMDFIESIKDADRTSLWHRSHLSEWEIPYIFLVTRDWPPVESPARTLRREWLRFWFDGRVRTLDDLWIRREGPINLIRTTYRNPARKGPPRLKHVIRPERRHRVRGFLTDPPPAVHKYVVGKMLHYFPRELSAAAP